MVLTAACRRGGGRAYCAACTCGRLLVRAFYCRFARPASSGGREPDSPCPSSPRPGPSAENNTLQLGQGIMALAAARLTDPSFSNRVVAVKTPSSFVTGVTMAPVQGKPGQYQIQLPAGERVGQLPAGGRFDAEGWRSEAGLSLGGAAAAPCCAAAELPAPIRPPTRPAARSRARRSAPRTRNLPYHRHKPSQTADPTPCNLQAPA
jgi:hypothetical protein